MRREAQYTPETELLLIWTGPATEVTFAWAHMIGSMRARRSRERPRMCVGVCMWVCMDGGREGRGISYAYQDPSPVSINHSLRRGLGYGGRGVYRWPYFYNLLVGPSYIPSPLYLATVSHVHTHALPDTYTRLHEREPGHWPAGR